MAKSLVCVHGAVGDGDEALRVLGIARECGDAEARTQIHDVVGPQLDLCLADGGLDTVDRLDSFLIARVGQDDEELVAGVTNDGIAVANVAREYVGKGTEHSVSLLVAVVVVDALEVIEVDGDERGRSLAFLRPADLLFEGHEEVAGIGEAGELVGQRGLLGEPILVGVVDGDSGLARDRTGETGFVIREGTAGGPIETDSADGAALADKGSRKDFGQRALADSGTQEDGEIFGGGLAYAGGDAAQGDGTADSGTAGQIAPLNQLRVGTGCGDGDELWCKNISRCYWS